MVDTDEHTVWTGRPSQLLNLHRYLALAIGAGALTWLLLALRPVLLRGASLEIGTAAISIVTWAIVGLWSAAVLAALGIAAITASTRYELTSERLRITVGILSTTTDEVELRRVRDFVVHRAFLQRLMGLGEVRLATADVNSPAVVLRGVRDPDALQGTIRRHVQLLVRQYGVREIDVY